MQLLNDLQMAMQSEKSMFAAQLLKEDISRLERLLEIAGANADPSAFAKQAMLPGWTAGDMRTFELNPELGAFLEVMHRHAHPGSEPSPSQDEINLSWAALHKRRIDLLVGCLSRPRID